MRTSLATSNVLTINAFPKLAEDRAKRSTVDPVVLIWKQLSEKLTISEELINAADEKIKFLSDETIEPEIVCYFPDFKGLPTHGMRPQEPIVVSCEAEALKAAKIAKTRASHYGKAEKNEAEKLGNKWLKDIKEALTKAEMLKDVLGFTKLSEESDAFYAETQLLRQKLFKTKAASVEGISIQVTEMRQYLHYNSWQDSLDQLAIIEEGLKDLQ